MKAAKLQTVKTLPTFNEFIQSLGFNQYIERAFYKTLLAYEDCLDIEHGDIEQRNLDFITKETVDVSRVIQFAEIIKGYNYFTPKVLNKVLEVLVSRDGYGVSGETELSHDDWIKRLNDSFDFYLAREGSVCIYIKAKRNLWARDVAKLEKLTDECMFCDLYGQTLLRLWWD